jgi:predicted metal-dependent hydrolase
MEEVRIDGLVLAVRRSDRRKSIGLTVERDGALAVLAPAAATTDELRDVIRTRETWLWAKLAEKEILTRAWSPKQYVAGEGHAYLGRHYRLMFVDQNERSQPPLRLFGGFFALRRDQRDWAAEHFAGWYRSRGREWLTKRVRRHLLRFGLAEGPVDVRDLGYRWGSCGERALHFHWRVMTLPPQVADYVIVHELAHMIEPRHDRAFWALVARVMPDYERRREWLAHHGADT